MKKANAPREQEFPGKEAFHTSKKTDDPLTIKSFYTYFTFL